MRYFFISIILLLGELSCAYGQDVPVFVVINAKTGKVLAERNAYRSCFPASTSKIGIAAYVASTPNLNLSQRLVVPSEAVQMLPSKEKRAEGYTRYPSYVLEKEGSSAGLEVGESLTVQDALWATMLCSGNDAANTLAYYWGGGSIERCCEKLTRFAKSLGCQRTLFKNPHGLHHPEHCSSAYDLALMAQYAMQLPLFRQVVSSQSYRKPATGSHRERVWKQTNRLLVPGSLFYEHATGVKTGFHSLARHCLVASGETPDRSIIVVLLQCPTRKKLFTTGKKMLHHFLFEEKKSHVVVEQGLLLLKRTIDGHKNALPVRSLSQSVVSYYSSEQPEVRTVVDWWKLRFPVEEGQQIGVIRVFADQEQVDSVPVVSHEYREATWLQHLLSVHKTLQKYQGVVFFVIAIVVLFLLWKFLRSDRRN